MTSGGRRQPAAPPRIELASLPGAAPRGLRILLTALAAIAPFSIGAYLPSLQDIGATLHATPIEVQQTLTAYMLPFAVMTLWHGALSDALGRRQLIPATLTLFALASSDACLQRASNIYGFFVPRRE